MMATIIDSITLRSTWLSPDIPASFGIDTEAAGAYLPDLQDPLDERDSEREARQFAEARAEVELRRFREQLELE